MNTIHNVSRRGFLKGVSPPEPSSSASHSAAIRLGRRRRLDRHSAAFTDRSSIPTCFSASNRRHGLHRCPSLRDGHQQPHHSAHHPGR